MIHVRFNIAKPEEWKVWNFIINVLSKVYPNTPTSRLIKLALYDYVRILEGKSSILESKLGYDRKVSEAQIEALKREIEHLKSMLEKCLDEKQELEDRIAKLEEELTKCREELRKKPRGPGGRDLVTELARELG